jgi:hypothetical protein
MGAIRGRNVEAVMQLFGENTITRDAISDYPSETFFTDVESVQGNIDLNRN